MSNVSDADRWSGYLTELLEHVERRNGEAAAHVLVQCLKHDEFSPEDQAGYDAMFKHPKVLEEGKVLWAYMVRELGPEFIEEVRREMIVAGWNI